MLNGKIGWIAGMVYFFVCITAATGENPADTIDEEAHTPAPEVPKEATEDERSVDVPHGESAAGVLRTAREPVRRMDYDAIRAANDFRRKLRTAAWGVIGGGALGMVGGLITGVYAKNKRDELIEMCGNSTTCVETPARTQIYSDAESAANAATVLFATGATMAVVGTVLLVVMKRKSKKQTLKVQGQPARGGALVFSRDF
jgi:hypothetical protein